MNSAWISWARIAALCLVVLGAEEGRAQGGVMRQVVPGCYQQGATTEALMVQCVGKPVSVADFYSCLNGGPCLGEPPFNAGVADSGACGAHGMAPCSQAIQCGLPGTVSCQFAGGCGTFGFPVCQVAQFCGPNTFPCPRPWDPPPSLARDGYYGAWRAKLNVSLPGSSMGSRFAGSVRFAAPALPKQEMLESCRQLASDKEGFFECLRERALPPEYKLTRYCLKTHESEPAAAFLCSAGKGEMLDSYARFMEVRECSKSAKSQADVAGCLAEPFLGANERYYLRCVAQNPTSMSAAVVCALAKDLSAEQKIGLDCAVATGGEPHAFVGCTSGRLLAREIDKCWQGGIGTDQGCFGPNNENRRFWNSVDGVFRQAVGQNNDLYRAFNLYKDNVLAPTASHDFVRAANTVLKDVRHGPGRNNDLVKLGGVLTTGAGLQSVAEGVGGRLSSALGFEF